MLSTDHTVQQHKKTNVYCPWMWRARRWREQSWCPGSRCRLKSTKHKYLVSWRMTGTIQLSYLGIRTLEQTQGGPVSFLDIPPASTEQIPQFFGNQTHTSGNTRQGRELATGYCAKLNGHNGDCNHFISREQSYTYNYWPLSTHGDCRKW